MFYESNITKRSMKSNFLLILPFLKKTFLLLIYKILIMYFKKLFRTVITRKLMSRLFFISNSFLINRYRVLDILLVSCGHAKERNKNYKITLLIEKQLLITERNPNQYNCYQYLHRKT